MSTSFSFIDHQMMKKALHLAEKGMNTTTPNPRVGCIIVKDGKIVGEGYHIEAGGPHAEIHALAQAQETAKGSTVYVTLEPCSHYGRTPPCVNALITAQVARVVVATPDPSPQISGRGISLLEKAGICIQTGLLESEARTINRGFFSRIERKRPWVTAKIACSQDGKTALLNGKSQWITCQEARDDAQLLRARSCAILTGSGTVLADNPRMTVRLSAQTRQPVRIVLDSKLQTLPQSNIYHEPGKAILVTSQKHTARFSNYKTKHITIYSENLINQQSINLDTLLNKLGSKEKFNEILVEAGPSLNGALLQSNLIDELIIYMAPTILGNQALSIANTSILQSLTEQYRFSYKTTQPVGTDLRLTLTK